MTKAYWISFYREIIDANKFSAYAKLAGPAIEAGGGRFLARAVAAQTYEAGLKERANSWLIGRNTRKACDRVARNLITVNDYY